MTRRIAATAALLLACALLAGCATFSAKGRAQYEQARGGAADPSVAAVESAKPAAPYDVLPLLVPAGRKKYLGLAARGAPASMKNVEAFAKTAGKKPNVVEFYSAWGDRYETRSVRNAWRYGALAYIAWEPFEKSLKEIAAGGSDAYIRAYARAVRDLDLPVAISFGHEMNGFWYPWGTKKATAAQFVAAFRHVHEVFDEVGATQVIWVWSPNVVNPMPDVRLKPYWPGDEYVDWVGVIGYYAAHGPATFDTLYGPTMDQVRAFTRKPVIIAETAAEAGPRKPADITDLFRGTAAHDDVIGFVWFDFDKEADWRVTSGSASAETFRQQAAGRRFGFDVTKP
ncbi:glycosyl hydrolase [Streptomyces sp. NPDC004542]|uniref:glycoside hydrolase family 26 protein n=1 Tax=Streptomyces sp. NPDC004542 TaxID=3154281 RepID=UPI0033A79844